MLSQDPEYSDAEIKLFTQLNLAHLLYLSAPQLYRAAVEHAFINNLSGPAIEALRRAAGVMLVKGKPYRLTEEFDKLLDY